MGYIPLNNFSPVSGVLIDDTSSSGIAINELGSSGISIENALGPVGLLADGAAQPVYISTQSNRVSWFVAANLAGLPTPTGANVPAFGLTQDGKIYFYPTGGPWALATASTAGALLIANNLSDVATKGTGRANLRIPILAAVQAAATANVNIASAPASVDGFSFVSSGLDTVLLTAQSTPSQNGIWVWNGAGSALTRPADFPTGMVLTTGREVLALNGTANIGTKWWLTVPSSGLTIDTTAQTWASVNITPNAVFESGVRANRLDQMANPVGVVTLVGINGTALSAPVSFLSSGTWTPSTLGQQIFAADVVGGGGAGKTATATVGGGGGGGGEVLIDFNLGTVSAAQTITVGAAAVGTGTAGNASSVGSIVTAGGGFAGNAGSGGSGGDFTPGGYNAALGGTGGGVRGGMGSGGGGPLASTQGGNGGPGSRRLGTGGGAGGGVNTNGGNSGGNQFGAAGTGVASAGGGGGAYLTTAGNGVSTTGGNGASAQALGANTGSGGGGGGAGATPGTGGTGASGVVNIYQLA